jgi:RNA polymerase sigma factor (TIGR02999 family)
MPMQTGTTTPPDAAQLLRALRHGDASAIERLLPLVSQEVRAIVGSLLADANGPAPRRGSAIVREAWERLVERRQPRGRSNLEWQDRANFLAIGAGAVRRALADHARARRATKRGELLRLTLDGSLARANEPSMDVVSFDRALSRLAELDLEQSRVIELRWFGGMTAEDVAHVLETTPRAVEDAWMMGRAWLRLEVGKFGTP